MDSDNSGSMNSSSGGEDEYESRGESISALLSNTPPTQLGSMSNNQHQLDPLSNIFDPLSTRFTNPNPHLNFDMAWSKTLRPDPHLAGLIPFSSSAHNQISQPFFTSNNNIHLGGGGGEGGPHHSRGGVGVDIGVGSSGGSSSSFAALQIPHDHQNVSASSSAPNNQAAAAAATNNNNGVGRNPKKRSRASRRAPTTVLTTDTTNFRAMVQEFTGIPAPPFSSSSSSPFPRTRLDLFGSAAASSLMRSGGGVGGGGGGLSLDSSPPSYLLRPFAHKVAHQLPYSMLDHHPNLQLPSSTNSTSSMNQIQNQNPNQNPNQSVLNINNMQNPSSSSSSPLVNFQSLFHSNPLTSNSSSNNNNNNNILPPNSKPPPHHHNQGSLDHSFSLNHSHSHSHVNNPEQLNVLPNNVMVSSSDVALSRSNEFQVNNIDNDDNNNSNNNVDHHHRLMGSIKGNYSNAKLNYSAAAAASSSNIVHDGGDKAGHRQSNLTTRSEGMVESWICSSD